MVYREKIEFANLSAFEDALHSFVVRWKREREHKIYYCGEILLWNFIISISTAIFHVKIATTFSILFSSFIKFANSFSTPLQIVYRYGETNEWKSFPIDSFLKNFLTIIWIWELEESAIVMVMWRYRKLLNSIN